jgi:RNA polymerase sigma-70 factor (ECF subfamily)
VTTPDEELMARMREQDSEALALLYDRHHRAAYSLAFRILQDAGQAEDVVQEAFVAVWRHATRYDPAHGVVRPWLLTIVHHRAINQLRQRAASGPLRDLDETLVDRRQPEVWQTVYQTIRQEEIRAALNKLTTNQRVVVDLAYFGGLTHREIADHLHVPLGTVKSRMGLAYRKLELWLKPYAADGGLIH